MKSPITFMGIPVHACCMNEVVAEIGHRIDNGKFTQHVVVNVAKIVQMRDDADLKNAVLGCDIINIDGMGVVWGARFLGHEVPERVAGIDLFLRLLELAAQKKYSVYFLGARPAVVEKAANEAIRLFPKLNISGYHHGYFENQVHEVVKKIRSSGADLLFVAMPSPQKEKFISLWRKDLGVSFAMGVGGTFDVVAGITKRAPLWMQQYGLEWFFRLVQEPRRMWKRYLTTNLIFFYLLIIEKSRKNPSKK